MAKAITLLRGPAPVAPPGEVGLLFECAPDGQVMRQYPDAIGLSDLIGDFSTIKQRAYDLSVRLLENEPPLRGLRQLAIFDELVIRDLQRILHAKALHDMLASNDIRSCVFTHPSGLAQDLKWFTQQLGTSISVTVPGTADHSPASAMQRSWRRLQAARFSRAALGSEWRQVMERVDPFQRRARLVRHTARPRRRLWFYSTAYTFSRIGLTYEPYFPEPFEYLVEDPWTGGVPIAAIGRLFSSPYDFVALGMAPTRTEVVEAKEAVRIHLKTVDLPVEDEVVRAAYLNGPGLATFTERLLPQGLFQTELFRRFVEVTEPTALVTGNPVFEGYALHAARQTGVPTFLLQHGILGDFCQFVDPPADHYLVRGEFWRRFLAPKARTRSLVLNPTEVFASPARLQIQKRSVLFLTASYGPQEFWDESDLDDILRTLLAACRQVDADLIVRVHPMEHIGKYESAMQRLTGDGGAGVSVTCSQGPGLDELLARSAVAVTFSSTVFLDCLRHRVPIISFGWHDFSYKRQIREYGVFHFCESLAELLRLIHLALRGELPAFSNSVAPFLADTPDLEIRGTLRRLLSARSAAA